MTGFGNYSNIMSVINTTRLPPTLSAPLPPPRMVREALCYRHKRISAHLDLDDTKQHIVSTPSVSARLAEEKCLSIAKWERMLHGEPEYFIPLHSFNCSPVKALLSEEETTLRHKEGKKSQKRMKGWK